MTDLLASALSRQRILLDNSLATVASECVVVRASMGNSRSILSLSQIRHVSAVKLSHPGLLVLAMAAFLIAAGAHFSKDGGSAEFPISFVGLLFVVGFVVSRRAAVCFTSIDGMLQTVFGAPSEAAAVISHVRTAMDRLKEESESESLAS